MLRVPLPPEAACWAPCPSQGVAPRGGNPLPCHHLGNKSAHLGALPLSGKGSAHSAVPGLRGGLGAGLFFWGGGIAPTLLDMAGHRGGLILPLLLLLSLAVPELALGKG